MTRLVTWLQYAHTGNISPFSFCILYSLSQTRCIHPPVPAASTKGNPWAPSSNHVLDVVQTYPGCNNACDGSINTLSAKYVQSVISGMSMLSMITLWQRSLIGGLPTVGTLIIVVPLLLVGYWLKPGTHWFKKKNWQLLLSLCANDPTLIHQSPRVFWQGNAPHRLRALTRSYLGAGFPACSSYRSSPNGRLLLDRP